MGHRTWLTLKKPLKDRLNIVLSRQSQVVGQANAGTARRGEAGTLREGDAAKRGRGDAETLQESVITLTDARSVLALARYLRCDLFVMGGAQVYRSFLPYIERWIVTEVPLTVEGADVFVPENYLDGFSRVRSKQLDEELSVGFYERDL